MAICKLIANGSFGPDEIEVMKSAYEAALIDVGVTDQDDPITDLIARSIVTVTSTGERDPHRVMERALNAPRRSEGCRLDRSRKSRAGTSFSLSHGTTHLIAGLANM